MSAEYAFSFEIKLGGKTVGLIEDGTAVLSPDPNDPDEYFVSAIWLSGQQLPESHYLYQPIMLWLLGAQRKELDMEWHWRPATPRSLAQSDWDDQHGGRR